MSSTGIIAAFVVAGLVLRRPLADAALAAVGVLNFGITVTNGLFSVFLSLICLGPRRGGRLVGITLLGAAVVFWFRPGKSGEADPATRVVGPPPSYDRVWFLNPDAVSPARSVASLIYHSMLFPEIRPAQYGFPRGSDLSLVTQRSSPGSGGPFGRAGVVAWSAALLAATVALPGRRAPSRLEAAVGVSLLSQVGLHAVYGREAFLYSLDVVPLLLVWVARGLSRVRTSVALLSGLTLGALFAVNNHPRFQEVASATAHPGSQRAPVPGTLRYVPRRVLAHGMRRAWRAEVLPDGTFRPRDAVFGVTVNRLPGSGPVSEGGDLHWRLAEGTARVQGAGFRGAWTSRKLGVWEFAVAAEGKSPGGTVYLSDMVPDGIIFDLWRWEPDVVILDGRWLVWSSSASVELGIPAAAGPLPAERRAGFLLPTTDARGILASSTGGIMVAVGFGDRTERIEVYDALELGSALLGDIQAARDRLDRGRPD